MHARICKLKVSVKLLTFKKEVGYFIFLQRSHIFRWDAQGPGKWQKMDDLKLEIPHDTVLEVEVVEELRGEVRKKKKWTRDHLGWLLMFSG